MPLYSVQYEVTKYDSYEYEDEGGDIVYDDSEESWEDSEVVEAEDQDEARDIVYDTVGLDYDEFFITSVTEV